jgi:Lrp/AsnC family transcriptional regulator
MIDLGPRDLRELQRDAAQSIEVLSARCTVAQCLLAPVNLRTRCHPSPLAPSMQEPNLGLRHRREDCPHDPKWLEKFAATVKAPEIIGLPDHGRYRLSAAGVVSDIAGYDRLYKRLIAKIPLTDVSSSFVMEKIKETTALPLDSLG